MAGLGPGIRGLASFQRIKDVDGRHKAGHDMVERAQSGVIKRH
jgi:hypothetical protein